MTYVAIAYFVALALFVGRITTASPEPVSGYGFTATALVFIVSGGVLAATQL